MDIVLHTQRQTLPPYERAWPPAVLVRRSMIFHFHTAHVIHQIPGFRWFRYAFEANGDEPDWQIVMQLSTENGTACRRATRESIVSNFLHIKEYHAIVEIHIMTIKTIIDGTVCTAGSSFGGSVAPQPRALLLPNSWPRASTKNRGSSYAIPELNTVTACCASCRPIYR